ncbi:MAG: hypothetical protein IJ083_02070 [Clostridia bacterium]|nr:hypothetical protein [Clostridia bacterium]
MFSTTPKSNVTFEGLGLVLGLATNETNEIAGFDRKNVRFKGIRTKKIAIFEKLFGPLGRPGRKNNQNTIQYNKKTIHPCKRGGTYLRLTLGTSDRGS